MPYDQPKTIKELLIGIKVRQTEEKLMLEYLQDVVQWAQRTGRLPRSNQSSSRPLSRKPPLRRPLSNREKTIRKAIREGLEGKRYAKYLDDNGLTTPAPWQKHKDNPCLSSHTGAYKDAYWRAMVQKEKSRVKNRMTAT